MLNRIALTVLLLTCLTRSTLSITLPPDETHMNPSAPSFTPTSTRLDSTTGYTPTYHNRIIFIRHAEKGFATDPNPDTHPPSHKGFRGGRGGGRGGRGRTSSAEQGGWFSSWFKRDDDHEHHHGPNDWPPPPGRGRPGRDGPPGKGGPGGGGFPGGGPGGKMPNGLSVEGKERAQYLRSYFSPNTSSTESYDIGMILAAPRSEPDKEGERTYATVKPLADDLGLEVQIDCANEPASCIVSKVEEFAKTSDKDVLISWKHFDLNGIATALGAPNARKTYPDRRNDIVWIMYDGRIQEKRSQHCPILDDQRSDEHDPDLVVEEDSWGYDDSEEEEAQGDGYRGPQVAWGVDGRE